MSLVHRSYSGKIFRPKPEIHFEDQEKLLIVATPWGNRAGGRRSVEALRDYFLTNAKDTEATSPFPRIPQLSPVANNLRIGTLLANDYLLNFENKDEYKNGVEFFAAAFDTKELVWLQIGNPHLLLKRSGRPLQTLSSTIDLSMELSPPDTPYPPLPNDILGIDRNPNVLVNSFRPGPGDKLILISRSWLPENLFSLPEEHLTIDDISITLSRENEDLPFWLAIWTL